MDHFAEIMMPDGTHKRATDFSVAILNRDKPLLCQNFYPNIGIAKSRKTSVLLWNNIHARWDLLAQNTSCHFFFRPRKINELCLIYGWDGVGQVPAEMEDKQIAINSSMQMHEISATFLAVTTINGKWYGFSFCNTQVMENFKNEIYAKLSTRESIQHDNNYPDIESDTQVYHSRQEFFFSVAMNRLDSNVRRGSRIKAIGIITPHRFYSAFKPLIDSTLECCFNELELTKVGEPVDNAVANTKSVENKARILNKQMIAQLLHKLNAITVESDVPSYYPLELRTMLRQTNLTASLAAPDSEEAQKQSNNSLPTTIEMTLPAFEDCAPSKVSINLTHDPEEVHEASILTLAKVFGGKLAAIWRGFLDEKRILFIGENMPAGKLANAVLSSVVLTRPLQNQISRAFPYINLQHLDKLLETKGYIAGTSNPIFKTHLEWWDILCDLASGEIFYSTQCNLFNSKTRTNQSPSKNKGDDKNNPEIDSIPDKYIDRNVSDAIEAAVNDLLPEEWIRSYFQSLTTSVLKATQANRIPLKSITTPGIPAKRIATNNAANVSPSKKSKAILWGDFGVVSTSWSDPQATATIRTRAQMAPNMVNHVRYDLWEMAINARAFEIQKLSRQKFEPYLCQTSDQSSRGETGQKHSVLNTREDLVSHK